jgi:hypothetical protein
MTTWSYTGFSMSEDAQERTAHPLAEKNERINLSLIKTVPIHSAYCCDSLVPENTICTMQTLAPADLFVDSHVAGCDERKVSAEIDTRNTMSTKSRVNMLRLIRGYREGVMTIAVFTTSMTHTFLSTFVESLGLI